MTLAHPGLLLLVILPLAWAGLAVHSAVRPVSLALKALSLAAILFAFTEPVITLPETKVAEVLLVDTSASIPSQDLARASSLATEISRERGRNWVKVVPFDTGIHALSGSQLRSGIHLERVVTEAANGTNLEAALTGGVTALPEGYLPRFLLLSDGNENQGSVVRAIAQLKRLGIPVDTVPLGDKSGSGLRLESVSLPREAFSGEQIPVDLRLVSPDSAAATLDIYAEGKLLGHQTLNLHGGANSVRVNARVKSSGVVAIGGRIQQQNSGDVRFEQALQLRRAKVLYLSQDPAGTDSNLLAALAQANIEVTRDASEIDKDLIAFQLVVLNNLDLGSISAGRKSRIENYVRDGGGLLLIGGERQVYKEEKQMDALDRALPAKLSPPDTPKGTCVALIIDKSSSMEGRKIELARLSAIGVVDHLRPLDTIGVLIFDNSFQWAVPLRRVEDRSLIKRLISGITPDGGTQIAPALAEAYRRVLPSLANFKHIVLLTDGISEEGDSIDLAREAAQHDVTISTVGLGQDVNRSYLEKIASTSGGKSYFLNEPMGLEQILLKDVETYSGSTAVEKIFKPIIAGPSDVLEAVGMENAPPLRGYTRYKVKPGAETVLEINPGKKDPLYVRWQYGLGRAAVFSSDAKSRWAEAWMTWPGFDKFWTNVTRDLLVENNRSEATAEFDPGTGELLARYRLSSTTPEPRSIPALYVLGPNGFRKEINVKRNGTREYEGRLAIGTETGLFRVRPVSESVAFPEIGLYREQPELKDSGTNESVMRQLSLFTGGRYNPPVSDVFNTGGRRNFTQWQLWPVFLGLAIALSIAELAARKWRGLRARFRRA